ncbi:hypothetical protein KBI33_01035 [Candidatus Shapirobacteria bacterium]|nr:hypothetical protein [Candidatus Shapirobacteria bacterium]
MKRNNLFLVIILVFGVAFLFLRQFIVQTEEENSLFEKDYHSISPTKEVISPTKEVISPTKEVISPTKEVISPTKEVISPTEEEIDYLQKEKLISLLPVRKSDFDMEYLAQDNVFIVLISANDFNAGKRKAISWLESQGISNWEKLPLIWGKKGGF